VLIGPAAEPTRPAPNQPQRSATPPSASPSGDEVSGPARPASGYLTPSSSASTASPPWSARSCPNAVRDMRTLRQRPGVAPDPAAQGAGPAADHPKGCQSYRAPTLSRTLLGSRPVWASHHRAVPLHGGAARFRGAPTTMARMPSGPGLPLASNTRLLGAVLAFQAGPLRCCRTPLNPLCCKLAMPFHVRRWFTPFRVAPTIGRARHRVRLVCPAPDSTAGAQLDASRHHGAGPSAALSARASRSPRPWRWSNAWRAGRQDRRQLPGGPVPSPFDESASSFSRLSRLLSGRRPASMVRVGARFAPTPRTYATRRELPHYHARTTGFCHQVAASLARPLPPAGKKLLREGHTRPKRYRSGWGSRPSAGGDYQDACSIHCLRAARKVAGKGVWALDYVNNLAQVPVNKAERRQRARFYGPLERLVMFHS